MMTVDVAAVEYINSLLRRAEKAEAEVARLTKTIGELLSKNGCDCSCDHCFEDHEEDCERCFACAVNAALTNEPLMYRDTITGLNHPAWCTIYDNGRCNCSNAK